MINKIKAYGIALYIKKNNSTKLLLCKSINSNTKWGFLKGVEDDNDLDEIISKVYDNSTKTKEEEMEELEKSLKKIPNDTLLRAREFKKVMFSSRKYRLARVAFRRYNLNNINSRIIRILPQQWYDAIVETPQRFFTGNRGKIKGERVWRESIIKSRRI